MAARPGCDQSMNEYIITGLITHGLYAHEVFGFSRLGPSKYPGKNSPHISLLHV